MAGKWTEERRKAAAERCRASKPWQHSTGPKSEKGKSRSSLNALKTGEHSLDYTHAREMLRLNRQFMEQYLLFYKYDLPRFDAKRKKLTQNERLCSGQGKVAKALMPTKKVGRS